MKAFDEFCKGRMMCQQAMTCDDCEFTWYEQRCEELEKQIEQLKKDDHDADPWWARGKTSVRQHGFDKHKRETEGGKG